MNEELQKSLVQLIDESLAEIEELRKSDRFSASEVSIGDSKSGIDGRDKDGSLGKEEDSDEDDEEEDEKKKKEDKDMDKAEGKNREADPNGGHHQVVKGEMMAGSPDGSSKGGAEGTNRQADPNGGHHQVAKQEGMSKMEERMDKMEKMMEKMEAYMSGKKMEKSAKSEEDLLKSVDARFSSLESKFETMTKLIQEIADAPVPSKSVSYKGIQPLVKSSDAGEESLSKGEIANKLFDLKKSGVSVDSKDITSVELGGPAELAKIVAKYNIK